jgi:hypothetical protein
MIERDQAYFLSRAEREIELAQLATDARAVHAHYLLSEFYLERAYDGSGEPARAGSDVAAEDRH